MVLATILCLLFLNNLFLWGKNQPSKQPTKQQQKKDQNPLKMHLL